MSEDTYYVKCPFCRRFIKFKHQDGSAGKFHRHLRIFHGSEIVVRRELLSNRDKRWPKPNLVRELDSRPREDLVA